MEVTFLTDEQIWGVAGGHGQLQVMKNYGTPAALSDLAIILGGVMGDINKTSDNQLSGLVWSASSFEKRHVISVHTDGHSGGNTPRVRASSARPVLPSSVASSISLGEAKAMKPICDGKVEVWQYGEYPQAIAARNVSDALNLLTEKELAKKTTGKEYTFDGEKYDAYSKPFSEENAMKCPEYQYYGKQYIRVKAKPFSSYSVLSNGDAPKEGESYWVEVQPIEWLRDPSGICVARQALFAGVQFDTKEIYDGKFEKTAMNKYLLEHFAIDMQAGCNVGTPAALGPKTTDVILRRQEQRERALNDPSQGL